MDRPQPTVEPWRRRLIRKLLYGSNVDRGVKAKARVGLAVIAFALLYGVIAGRLIMFAVTSESHHVRRAAGQDAVGTARPDSSIATARCWRPTCDRPRCSESRIGSSTSTKRSSC